MTTDAFQDVPAFVTVVETGGFAAAARELKLTRSAIGKAVARLEDRLQVRLFNRTTRTQSLTAEGQVFYESCQRALEELRAGQAQLDSSRINVAGTLRVSMPVMYGRLYVAPVLLRLVEAHPRLELELSFNDELVNFQQEGFDLVIRTGQLNGGLDIVARRIEIQQTAAYASPAFKAQHGLPRTPSDIQQFQTAAYSRNGQLQKWVFPHSNLQPETVVPTTRLRFDDLEPVRNAATSGLGIAWLPSWLIKEEIRTGSLVRVFPEIPPHLSDIHVVWSSTPVIPMRIRVAIDALTAKKFLSE